MKPLGAPFRIDSTVLHVPRTPGQYYSPHRLRQDVSPAEHSQNLEWDQEQLTGESEKDGERKEKQRVQDRQRQRFTLIFCRVAILQISKYIIVVPWVGGRERGREESVCVWGV